MSDDRELTITPTIVSAALELVYANIDLSRIASVTVDDDPQDLLTVGMIAYGSLLMTVSRKLGVDLNMALSAADAVLGGYPPPLERVN